MIFLVVFAIIAIIVISLNIKDSSNLEKIENYFNSQDCQNVIYSKGTYKGICKDKIMQIENSFSVDLDKNKTFINFANIKNIEQKKFSIIINKTYNIEFKTKETKDIFYKSLEEKINK